MKGIHPVPVAMMEALMEHCRLLKLKLKTELLDELKEELVKQRELKKSLSKMMNIPKYEKPKKPK